MIETKYDNIKSFVAGVNVIKDAGFKPLACIEYYLCDPECATLMNDEQIQKINVNRT